MISKEKFVEIVDFLKLDYEYCGKLNNLTSEYNQENIYGFGNHHNMIVLDILLEYALGSEEKTECCMDYIYGSKEMTFVIDNKTTKVTNAGELYDVLEDF